jgi:hypothetical protein
MKRKREHENASKAQQWRTEAKACLWRHLLKDLLPLVLEYAAELHLDNATRRFLCERKNKENVDGEFSRVRQMQLVQDELFVLDRARNNIQVFHYPTGRFLRKRCDPLQGYLQGGFAADPAKQIMYYSSTGDNISACALSDFRQTQTWKNTMPISHLYDSNSMCLLGNVLYVKSFRCAMISRISVDNGEFLGSIYYSSRELRFAEAFTGMTLSDDAQQILIPNWDTCGLDSIDTKDHKILQNAYVIPGRLFRPCHSIFHGSHVTISTAEEDKTHNQIFTLDRHSGQEVPGSHIDFDGYATCMVVCPKSHELIVYDESHRRLVVFF